MKPPRLPVMGPRRVVCRGSPGLPPAMSEIEAENRPVRRIERGRVSTSWQVTLRQVIL